MSDSGINKLESRVEALIVVCQQLAKEKERLKAKEDKWMTERARLIENDTLTKGRLKVMLDRLKALEEGV